MGVLVTGGAGYIGSHTVWELRKRQETAVYDNLSKGHRRAVPADIPFVAGDIREEEKLRNTIEDRRIDTVIHFAADSLVGESMQEPAKYYENNVVGTLALLNTLRKCGVKCLVFSSTAAVYGEPEAWPIREDFQTNPANVYGRTKLVIEGILADYARAYGLRYVSLRYFNAAGAHDSGKLGEDHTPETHLIPLVLKTALGQREAIDIYGTDYPTPDGTCIRDYIHVTDLARAHVLAVEHLQAGGDCRIYNLGSETGYSVREVIDRAKAITGVDFPVREKERRPGDPAVLVASARRIREELGWEPVYGLDAIIAAAWQWHRANPRGFDDYREAGRG